MDLIPRRFYFDDLFDDMLVPSNATPKCDIYEKEGKYHLEMDIPGFNKEDIKLDCEKGYLTITATKENKKEEHDGKKYIRRERTYSKFARSFYLEDADEDSIEAEFKNGTLHICVAKQDQSKNKKYIEIK